MKAPRLRVHIVTSPRLFNIIAGSVVTSGARPKDIIKDLQRRCLLPNLPGNAFVVVKTKRRLKQQDKVQIHCISLKVKKADRELKATVVQL